MKTFDPLIKKIVKHCYPDYKGRKFYILYDDEVDTNFNANWGGGTKTYYKFCRLDNGNIFDIPDFAPWNRPKDGKTAIPQGAVCVTHSFFQGHECGCTVIFPKNQEIGKHS